MINEILAEDLRYFLFHNLSLEHEKEETPSSDYHKIHLKVGTLIVDTVQFETDKVWSE